MLREPHVPFCLAPAVKKMYFVQKKLLSVTPASAFARNLRRKVSTGVQNGRWVTTHARTHARTYTNTSTQGKVLLVAVGRRKIMMLLLYDYDGHMAATKRPRVARDIISD